MAMAEQQSRMNRIGGFTLLELLVVIAILGLILAALTNGVRFAGQAWQVQERQSSRQGDLDAVQNQLRNLLAAGTAFEGDSTSLRFVSALPQALARGGLYDVELYWTGDRLQLGWRPHFKGPSKDAAGGGTELAKDVAGLNLSYYVGTEGWQPVTADKSKSPELIRVAVVFNDGRTWVPLLVAPMIELVPAVTK
jgi:prepilin-type N-terminal cleavage/methylation domain-containing protein